ncbi:MAG TPA: hypothetical protein VHP14_07575 [Anaerolineales bacterium]|nr:hypothetical protein [Anaerolineales bacterium]
MNMKFLVGVLILVLATCSLYSPTPRGSGVTGQVLIGPTCPVVQEGQACPDGQYQATLTVKSPGGVQIAQVQTDVQGHFRIPLVPGNYTLHPESPDGIAFADDQAFVVESGRYTQLTVNYDSGIR